MNDVRSEPELEEAYKTNFKNRYYKFDKYLMDNATFMDLVMLKNLQPHFFTEKEGEVIDNIEKESLISSTFIPLELYGMMYYDEDTKKYEDIFETEPLIEIGFEKLKEENDKSFVTGILELDFDIPIDENYLNSLSSARRLLFKTTAIAEDFADENYKDTEVSKNINFSDFFDSNISDLFHVTNRVKDRYKYLIQNINKKKMSNQSSLVSNVQQILNERMASSLGGKKKDQRKTRKALLNSKKKKKNFKSIKSKKRRSK